MEYTRTITFPNAIRLKVRRHIRRFNGISFWLIAVNNHLIDSHARYANLLRWRLKLTASFFNGL